MRGNGPARSYSALSMFHCLNWNQFLSLSTLSEYSPYARPPPENSTVPAHRSQRGRCQWVQPLPRRHYRAPQRRYRILLFPRAARRRGSTITYRRACAIQSRVIVIHRECGGATSLPTRECYGRTSAGLAHRLGFGLAHAHGPPSGGQLRARACSNLLPYSLSFNWLGSRRRLRWLP